MKPKEKIIPHYDGDLRIDTLFEALLDVIRIRSKNMTAATIIGTIELLKDEVKKHMVEM